MSKSELEFSKTGSQEDLFELIRQQRRFDDICAKNWSIPRRMLEGLEHPELDVFFTINRTEYLQIRDHLKQSSDIYRNGEKGLNRLAYKAYLLFGSVQKLEGFRKLCEHEDKTSLTCAARMRLVKFPPAEHWRTVKFRDWGAAFLTYGFKQIENRFAHLSMYGAPVRNAEGSISLLLTDFKLSAAKHKNPGNAAYVERLMQLAIRFKKNANEFERALETMSKPYEGAELPLHEWLPGFRIQGHLFGIPGAVFRKLEHNDPRLLFLGDFTNCCERVTDVPNNLEKTVIQASNTNRNAYYVVELEDEILAHSWAWRGSKGEMVFDGFESYEYNFNADNLRDLLEVIVSSIKDDIFSAYEFNGLYVGKTANHLETIFSSCRKENASPIMPQHITFKGMSQDSLYELVASAGRVSYSPYASGYGEPGHCHIRLG